MRHVKYSTLVYQRLIPMLKREQSHVLVLESVYYLLRMILIWLWRKIELTNPYENLAQIYEIREFPENTPTVRQIKNNKNRTPLFLRNSVLYGGR